MNRTPISNRDTTTAVPNGEGGSSADHPLPGPQSAFQQLVSRIMLVLTLIALCMIGTGSMLRFAVSQLNNREPIGVGAEVRQTSHSNESTLDSQTNTAEALRVQARAFDERLLSERRDRRWFYETQDLPDEDDARRAWQTQVSEIEAQIAEAQQLQMAMEANQENPQRQEPSLFEEGSVLHGRLKKLERLRGDAPL